MNVELARDHDDGSSLCLKSQVVHHISCGLCRSVALGELGRLQVRFRGTFAARSLPACCAAFKALRCVL
jgi:hypothetical protein